MKLVGQNVISDQNLAAKNFLMFSAETQTTGAKRKKERKKERRLIIILLKQSARTTYKPASQVAMQLAVCAQPTLFPLKKI